MATRACIGSRIDGGNIEDDEKEEASSGKIHFYKIKALGFYFLLGRLGCGSLVFIYFYHFNHLRVQFIGIKYIHIIVQPSPLFVSRIFSSSHAETLCPLNNNSPSSPPSAPRKPCSLFYFWIWLFQVYHIRGIILDWPTNSGFSTRRYRETQTNFLANPTQYLSFCVWHVSLSIVFKFYPCRISSVQFSSFQLLSRVRLFATPWIAACQASLSITNSRSLLKLMSIESMMPSNHLILCHPLLLLPPTPPSIRIFSSESTLHMRWPKY